MSFCLMLSSFHILHLNDCWVHLICFYRCCCETGSVLHLKRPTVNHALSGDWNTAMLVTRAIRIWNVWRGGMISSPPTSSGHFCSHSGGRYTVSPQCPSASALDTRDLLCPVCRVPFGPIWSPLSPFNQAVSDRLHGTESLPDSEWQLGHWKPR